MTDQELIEAFYADIRREAEHTVDPEWLYDLFNFKDHEATYREFFELLPEPLRSYAFEETCQVDHMESIVDLEDLFDYGFVWHRSKHGQVWRELNSIVGKLLDDYDKMTIPTVEELLSIPPFHSAG